MGLLYDYQKVDSPSAPIKTDYYKIDPTFEKWDSLFLGCITF